MPKYWQQIDQTIWEKKISKHHYQYIYGKPTAGQIGKEPFWLTFKLINVSTENLAPQFVDQLIREYYYSPRFYPDKDDQSLALMIADHNFDIIKTKAAGYYFNNQDDYKDAVKRRLFTTIKRKLNIGKEVQS